MSTVQYFDAVSARGLLEIAAYFSVALRAQPARLHLLTNLRLFLFC